MGRIWQGTLLLWAVYFGIGIICGWYFAFAFRVMCCFYRSGGRCRFMLELLGCLRFVNLSRGIFISTGSGEYRDIFLGRFLWLAGFLSRRCGCFCCCCQCGRGGCIAGLCSWLMLLSGKRGPG